MASVPSHTLRLEDTVESVTVLVIDDDEQWARVTGRLLEQEAFRVETAHSTAEGRTRFDAIDPDCVVCDYDLGDGTGIDVLDAVRRADPHRPFVLVTGKRNVAIPDGPIEQDATEYIRKGSDNEREHLANRLRTLVRSYRTTATLERRQRVKTIALDLLAEPTTAELCERLCDRLTAHEQYAMAWIGGTDERTPALPTASSGHAVPDSIENVALSSDPARTTIERGDPASVSAGELPTAWQRLADEYEIERVVTAPVTVDEPTNAIGMVLVSVREPTDRSEQTVETAARALSYALGSIDRTRSVHEEWPVERAVTIADPAVPLVELADRLPAHARIEATTVQWDPTDTTGYRLQLDGSSQTDLETAVEDCPETTLLAAAERSGTVVGALTTSRSTPEQRCSDAGVRVEQTVVEDTSATVTVRSAERSQLSTLETTIDQQFDEVSIDQSGARDREHDAGTQADRSVPGRIVDPVAHLTEIQRASLSRALREGYFDCETTATELATTIGISRQRFVQQLRAAQWTVFGPWSAPGGAN